jgi:acetylornithine deacetylase/succinyl-diaminopimelate desuccinylase-like protein
MLIPILAAEAMLKSQGALPVNVKFFFEGEEEIASPHLQASIEAHRGLLACDLVISADGTQWSEDQPALLIGLRGTCGLQIDVQGTSSDLHSGLYGGAVQNPIHALARLLDSMRSPDGKIAVEGFYDDVIPLTDEEIAHIGAVPYDEEDYKRRIGVDELFGEPGYTTFERAWTRPTLEVNGIWGGFQGEGSKTVIPSEAHAKITCRLVANQEPSKVIERVASHVKKHKPKGVRATVSPRPASARPYSMPADHPGNRSVHAVLQELYGKPPYYTRLGGSISACSLFLDRLRAYTLIFAFGLEDEGAHAPDEFFRLGSFDRGQRAYCMLLERLSQEEVL